MNHIKNPVCDNCKVLQETFKRLKVIKKDGSKTYLCRTCYKENRKNHREKTIDTAGIREDLKKLDLKRKVESAGGKEGLRKYQRERYRRLNPIVEKNFEPKIKGSPRSVAKPRHKSNCFVTLQERQTWLRLLMSRGLDFEDAKDRVGELVKYQAELRKQGKSESQIEKSKEEFLQELWQN